MDLKALRGRVICHSLFAPITLKDAVAGAQGQGGGAQTGGIAQALAAIRNKLMA